MIAIITPEANLSTFRLEEIDFQSPQEIARRVGHLYARMFPHNSDSFIAARFEAVSYMFSGRYPGFQPMDTAYHDLEHTLQATYCLAVLLYNRYRSGALPILSAEDFNIALIAILLHDIGYLKELDDTSGTGAKYTPIHEQRSCRHARTYLQQRDWSATAIQSVENLILCTGPRARIEDIPFASATEKLLGQAVCTADFIGQISDPRYPEKLPALYQEFVESFTHQKLPPEQWPYPTYEDLLSKTPGFYENFVVPRMNDACGNLWRFFNDQETGNNPYLASIRNNLARIKNRQRHPD